MRLFRITICREKSPDLVAMPHGVKKKLSLYNPWGFLYSIMSLHDTLYKFALSILHDDCWMSQFVFMQYAKVHSQSKGLTQQELEDLVRKMRDMGIITCLDTREENGKLLTFMKIQAQKKPPTNNGRWLNRT